MGRELIDHRPLLHPINTCGKPRPDRAPPAARSVERELIDDHSLLHPNTGFWLTCDVWRPDRAPRAARNVERELINHRSLLHPNIIRFKEVFLTSTHLGIGMEYAAGGELFDRIVKAGRFSEDEARFFFQQLISGVEYCHSEARALPLAQVPFPLCTGAQVAAPLLEGGTKSGRGSVSLCAASLCPCSVSLCWNVSSGVNMCLGRVPPRPEAGEHAAGRAAGAAAEDLRLWVQQVRGV